MIRSTFLTLLFIPTIYCFFDDISDILGCMLLKLQIAFSAKNTKLSLLLLTSLMLLASCAHDDDSAKTKAPASTYEQLWQAAYEVAKKYPLKDYSKSDGTMESKWIYENDTLRYKFYISVLHSQSAPIIDVQSQKRTSNKAVWRWIQPSKQQLEGLKNDISKQLKNNRPS